MLNNDSDIVPEQASLIILEIKSTVCMTKNGRYIKNTSHIARRMHFVRNVDMCKMHTIDWCEGGLQLAYIANKNVGEPGFTPSMKYIMVRLYN